MRFIDRDALAGLLAELRARGYDLVGPTVRDGVIALDRIEGPDDLPFGVREVQRAGSYHLDSNGTERFFGFANGPDSAKRFLFPATEVLHTAASSNGSVVVAVDDDAGRPVAFVGLRPCDLHAIAVQDRVLLRDPAYRRRREAAFFVGVNCAEPGGTCFCVSAGTGPRCTEGFDLALTELADGFLAQPGTARGGTVLAAVPSREATKEEADEDEAISARARTRMGREVRFEGLRDLLFASREHPEWADVAERCLACGNCTAVCPTCFCHDVVEASDLVTGTATGTREWATCYSTEFSHTAGGAVRTGRDAKYRQWLTHKFGSWIDQFGTSGCVGCGRCITWCPVGIDVTEELGRIAEAPSLSEVAP